MSGRARILIVDDDPLIVKMIAKRLEWEGFDAAVAADGELALAEVARQAPDLMVLDVMLPKVSGFEVCRRLKLDPAYQKIPIIMLTAKTLKGDENFGYECGADAYVRKPFDSHELLEKINLLIPG